MLCYHSTATRWREVSPRIPLAITARHSLTPPASSESSSSAFMCGICYQQVPKGDGCTYTIDGARCKGTRRPTEALPKAPPKPPPSLHTKGAAEVLSQQQTQQDAYEDGEDAM